MVPLSPLPVPPAHRSWLRFIHDRNPFYLLSAVCMFVGFRVIIEAVEATPGDWKTLMLLIFTLNVYEAALIGLALFLIVRRGLHRDGWILLTIEALFLVDLPNLNAELFTAAPRLGSVVSSICFLLAILKVGIVLRALKLRLSPGTIFYIAAQFAFMLGLPGIFRLMRSSWGAVSPMQIYTVWWMAGLLIAAGSIIVKRARSNSNSPMAALPGRLYVLMPLVSLLVHLASENRVYWVHFQAANLAPMILALVVTINRLVVWRSAGDALRATLVMVGMAVAVSIVPSDYHLAMTAHLGALILSPLRLALLGSGALMANFGWSHRSLIAAQCAFSCCIMACLGASLPEMVHRAYRAVKLCNDFALRLVPNTPLQWGYLAIASAFVLLAIGAMFSLKKPGPLSSGVTEHDPV